ncbi:MAG: hypothetical protein OXI60_01845 [Acidiferrobacterales bacterium]|nr:hypothetical protein [Acidiferrobacterales bacterium]
MVQRISSSQIRSRIKQAQSKQRQQVHKLNSEIRKFNSEQKRKVAAYNQEVRTFNTRVRANQNRLNSALNHFAQQSIDVRNSKFYKSVEILSNAYEQLDISGTDSFLTDIAEQETANSVIVFNSLIDNTPDPKISHEDICDSSIADELADVSPDLHSRWYGAIYALNPNNPDAARHFCSSSREIITQILDINAPKSDVLIHSPDCDKTKDGSPTRRAKIHYCLNRHGRANDTFENFVSADIDNVLMLFGELNAGTHGPAGKFSLAQLDSTKTRVKDAIRFMCEITRSKP